MSNVSQILTALSTQLDSVLPAAWSELTYVYDDEKNDFRGNVNKYGAGVEGGETTDGVNKSVTMDHTFFIKLTDSFQNRTGDTSERATISDLYDQFETIQSNFFQQKLGIPTVVLLVSDISMDPPLKIGDNTIMLKGLFTIKHRNATV